jgi:hypothetical protein
LEEIITDALRFVAKFYERMEQSALHIYHSALPFTPTECLLYDKYRNEMSYKVSHLGVGLTQWDALIVNMKFDDQAPEVAFSRDGSHLVVRTSKDLKFYDAMVGTPIKTCNFDRDNGVLVDDFSAIAVPSGNIVTLHSMTSNMHIARTLIAFI